MKVFSSVIVRVGNTLQLKTMNLQIFFVLTLFMYLTHLTTSVIAMPELKESSNSASNPSTEITSREIFEYVLRLTSFKSSDQSSSTFCHTAISGRSKDVEVHFETFHDLYIDFNSPRTVLVDDALTAMEVNTRPATVISRLSRQCYKFLQVSGQAGRSSESVPFAEVCHQTLGIQPHNVLFVFVGLKTQVQEMLTRTEIVKLTYKLALFFDTGEAYFPSSDFTYDETQHSVMPSAPNYRTNYAKGQQIRAGIIKFLPVVVHDPSGPIVTGAATFFFKEAAAKFNMTFSIRSEFTSSRRLPNGTWKGYMGDLTEDRLDIVYYLYNTISRFDSIYFSSHLQLDSIKFYISHPEIHLKWQAVFYPFDPIVWAIVLAIIALMIPVLFAHLQSRNPGPKAPRTQAQESSLESLYVAVAVPIAAIWQESIRIPWRIRHLGTGFVFYAMVLDTFYNSNLISYLTLPEPEAVPRTYHDLANISGKYKMLAIGGKGGAMASYFSSNTLPTIVRISQRLNFTSISTDCMIGAATLPKFACVSYGPFAAATSASNLSIHHTWNPLLESKDTVGLNVASLTMQKYSTLYEFWNYVVGQWRDTGLITQWEVLTTRYLKRSGTRWMRDLKGTNSSLERALAEKLHSQGVGGRVVPFGLKNCVVAFGAVGFGCLVAMVIFCIEILGNRCNEFESNRGYLSQASHDNSLIRKFLMQLVALSSFHNWFGKIAEPSGLDKKCSELGISTACNTALEL